jgi:hypothetical protein
MILELLIFDISFWLHRASQKGLFGRVWKACFRGDEGLFWNLHCFYLWRNFAAWRLEMEKIHKTIVISREFFSPFFEIKIIKLATSKSRHNS